MVARTTQKFVASPPTNQNPETYRQFVRLQQVLEEIDDGYRNIDGGRPDSVYGGLPIIDGGGVNGD